MQPVKVLSMYLNCFDKSFHMFVVNYDKVLISAFLQNSLYLFNSKLFYYKFIDVNYYDFQQPLIHNGNLLLIQSQISGSKYFASIM